MSPVTTREAAALYGCGHKHITGMARKFGVRPVAYRTFPVKPWGEGRTYLWNPADILRLRAEARKSRKAARLSVADQARTARARLEKRVRNYWINKARQRQQERVS